ncbi:MAG: hypothetical protein RL701_7169 [Pseudomonadota bacterium]
MTLPRILRGLLNFCFRPRPAQRLPNGNTLTTEGSDGRIFEVTVEHELVWEYISPYWRQPPLNLNLVYRAYRAPYDWVPQLDAPREVSVPRLDVKPSVCRAQPRSVAIVWWQ